MKKFKAETIVSRLFASMVERKQTLVDNGHTVSSEITKKNGLLDNFNPEGNSYREFLNAVENTKSVFDFEPLMKIISKAKPSGSSDAQYIQVKAIEKIVKFVKAFGYKDFRMLDNHTRNVMFNAMVNNGCISSKGAFASLVKVEFDALDDATSEILAKRANYTPGTGSTQVSSTRELFRLLGLTDGIKGAKNAAIEFTSEAKQALTEHFEPIANKIGAVIESEEEENEEA